VQPDEPSAHPRVAEPEHDCCNQDETLRSHGRS
jgi:hypothetical protein